MKIAIGVHGRFHAFELARALLERDHDVTLLTNYPRWAVEQFGFPGSRVRSFWPHGVLTRVSWRLRRLGLPLYREAALHRLFGRWARLQLERQPWDVVHLWSGVAEESLRAPSLRHSLHLLMRGSAHIAVQQSLLREEQERTAAPQDEPSAWMVAREQREYTLAHRIVTLSTFAANSFIQEGVEPSKIVMLPLGARLSAFRPSRAVVEARRARILSGAPLRVLYVGSLSFQKGLWDLAEVVRILGNGPFQFRLVGPHPRETQPLMANLRQRAIISPRVPQRDLPDIYAWGDVFVFPTIQDGYAQVLAQAAASGLPILATTNCAAPDLVKTGIPGWVVPIRSPRSLVERLRWCESHREELAALVQHGGRDFPTRDWTEVAADFETLCTGRLG